MNRRMRQQRGAVLVLVIIAMVFVGGVVTVITGFSVHLHRQRNDVQLDTCVRLVTDSAIAYVNKNVSKWSNSHPTQPINLPIDSLLPANAEGTAILIFKENQTGTVDCRVEIHLQRYGIGVKAEQAVPITKPTHKAHNKAKSSPAIGE